MFVARTGSVGAGRRTALCFSHRPTCVSVEEENSEVKKAGVASGLLLPVDAISGAGANSGVGPVRDNSDAVQSSSGALTITG